MIYDPITNLIDAINVCDTAAHCIGHRKETILLTAINDMMEAMEAFSCPETGKKLSAEEVFLYNRYLTYANRTLDSVIRQKKTQQTKVNINIADNITDASNVLQTALACSGTRRATLIARAEWELTRAKESMQY